MKNVKNEKPTHKKSITQQNPMNIYISLFLFILLLLPNYIWAGIKCLVQKIKDVRGQVIMVSTVIFF